MSSPLSPAPWLATFERTEASPRYIDRDDGNKRLVSMTRTEAQALDVCSMVARADRRECEMALCCLVVSGCTLSDRGFGFAAANDFRFAADCFHTPLTQ